MTEFAVVDMLKVDIEGAELEVFSQAAAEWLSRVNLIIVETHDRFRPGSDSAVRKAIQPAFEELPAWAKTCSFAANRGESSALGVRRSLPLGCD